MKYHQNYINNNRNTQITFTFYPGEATSASKNIPIFQIRTARELKVE